MSSRSDGSSRELAMGREERMLVTVLCRESIGLVAFSGGMDAVASLALEVSEALSSLGWPTRCKPAMGVGRADCCR